MSLFPRPIPSHHEDDPVAPFEAGASRLARLALLLVAGLLIWSVAARPLQFSLSDCARDGAWFGRAGANCAPPAKSDESCKFPAVHTRPC